MPGRAVGKLRARASQFWKMSRQLPCQAMMGLPSSLRRRIEKRFQGRLGSPWRRLNDSGR